MASLLSTLLPLDSVRLGRLILNTKAPYLEYRDPFPDRPTKEETIVNQQTNYKQTTGVTENSKLQSHLSSLFSISYNSKKEGTIELNIPNVKTHHLVNSRTWFETACADEETRRFLETAVRDRESVYLVIGFHTVQDATISRSGSARTSTGLKSDLPVDAVAGIGFVTRSLPLFSPSAESTQDRSRHQTTGFDAPGEQVYAIQYRKVRFNWLSRKKTETAHLEPGYRWKPCSDEDSWRGLEEDDDDDDEEEELLEALLEDDSDTEDWDEEYFGIDEETSSGDDQDSENMVSPALSEDS